MFLPLFSPVYAGEASSFGSQQRFKVAEVRPPYPGVVLSVDPETVQQSVLRIIDLFQYKFIF